MRLLHVTKVRKSYEQFKGKHKTDNGRKWYNLHSVDTLTDFRVVTISQLFCGIKAKYIVHYFVVIVRVKGLTQMYQDGMKGY